MKQKQTEDFNAEYGSSKKNATLTFFIVVCYVKWKVKWMRRGGEWCGATIDQACIKFVLKNDYLVTIQTQQPFS